MSLSTESKVDNSAFLFIKPHAATEKTIALVRSSLTALGIRVAEEGSIASEDIDKNKWIDRHYYAIASKATLLTPAQLHVPADRFKAKFGVEWADVLRADTAVNAMEACTRFGLDEAGIEKVWRHAEATDQVVKFGGGFYCGLLEVEGKDPLYVFNAFFMRMRAKYTAPGQRVYYFCLAWDSKMLSWANFRADVLGPTDPTKAPPGSLRGLVTAQWKELGLAAAPSMADNAVHASASPFEALAERMTWRQAKVPEDAFGSRLLSSGVSQAAVEAWSLDPQTPLSADSSGSIFDALEDLDSTACLEKCVELHKLACSL